MKTVKLIKISGISYNMIIDFPTEERTLFLKAMRQVKNFLNKLSYESSPVINLEFNYEYKDGLLKDFEIEPSKSNKTVNTVYIRDYNYMISKSTVLEYCIKSILVSLSEKLYYATVEVKSMT